MRVIALLIAVLLVTFLSNPVYALHPSGSPPQGGWTPGRGLTVGGSIGYLHGGPFVHSVASAGEVSLFRKFVSPISVWVTGGCKWVASEDVVTIPYVELGVNVLMFNIGAGYGVGVPDVTGRHHVNGIVGMAVPVFSRKRGRLLYLQGYYRPIFSFPGDDLGFSHEIGLMFKWLWAFDQR